GPRPGVPPPRGRRAPHAPDPPPSETGRETPGGSATSPGSLPPPAAGRGGGLRARRGAGGREAGEGSCRFKSIPSRGAGKGPLRGGRARAR
ncbi:hypothetical protein HGM15179_001456, partial [Zosterops borbonicus]